MHKFIPYGHQNIIQEDINSIIDILHSDWITQGPVIEKFEKAMANHCNAKYAVAVSSGTAALHLSCLSLDLKSGDYAWTSPNTFVASANCALYCGSNIDFVDIDKRTLNISIEKLEEKLIKAKKENKLPKILIPVHFAGNICDMNEIKSLSDKYGFKIIEDAAHALGSAYKNTKTGSCEFSDITTFSFHPVKIITTGEGGMILTNKKEIYEKLLMLRTHGITRNEQFMKSDSEGPWYYEQVDLGFNYRITDIQSALGLSQLKRLDDFIKRRNYLAERYNNLLKDLPITLPVINKDCYSAWHIYVIRLNLNAIKKTRKQVFNELKSANVGVNVHYIPVHTQPFYKSLGFKKGDFPNSEKYYEEAITLPLFYDLTEEEQDYIVSALKIILNG